jgi:hypothetical protein
MGASIIPAVLGAVTSIGGTMINANAQQQQIDAVNQAQRAAMERSKRVRMAEENRQDAMRKNQQRLAETSQEGQRVENVSKELEETKGARGEEATKFATDIAAMSPGEVALPSRSDTGMEIVNSDLGERLARAANQARTMLQAKSDLGAYDELFQNRARGLGRTSEELNFINKLREGSLATTGVQNEFVSNPYERSIAVGPGANIGAGFARLGESLMAPPSGGYG